MDFETAKELLLRHAGCRENESEPKWEHGFVGMFRPYRGLVASNFHEVMEALKGIQEHLKSEKKFERELVQALWYLVTWPRIWALLEGGMLPRNNLISAEDREILSSWLDRIHWAVAMLLEGAEAPAAFDGP